MAAWGARGCVKETVSGRQARVAKAALIILSFARAIGGVLGISLPVLQVVAAFPHQLTASIIGVIVAIIAGWLIVGQMDALTGVTLAMSLGLVVMAGIPLLQLCLLYTSPSPRDRTRTRMPSSA